jgi:hypothetical protein
VEELDRVKEEEAIKAAYKATQEGVNKSATSLPVVLNDFEGLLSSNYPNFALLPSTLTELSFAFNESPLVLSSSPLNT